MAIKLADRMAGVKAVERNGSHGVMGEALTKEESCLLPNGGEAMTKVDLFNWTMKDRQGRFQMLPKSDLSIDYEYQRDKVSRHRVLDIARAWSWKACGCLLVSRRPDGTLWVFDGQHRKLAADKRADIKRLPCLVFDEGDDGRSGEAEGFLAVNTVRGGVTAWHKHKAGVFAKVPRNVAVQQMVEAEGLTLSDHGRGTSGTVSCIAALLRQFDIDEAVCRRVWKAAVAIACGRTITDQFFVGLFHLERHLDANRLGSVAAGEHHEKLRQEGYDAIIRAIKRRVSEVQEGGYKPWTDGIIRYVLNHGRRSRKVPSVYMEG